MLFPSLARISVCRGVVKLSSRSFISKKMDSTELSTAFITCPNIETAKALARGMVEQNLAASVNLIPNVTSIYSWENKVEEDSEVLLIVKTKKSRIDGITDYIKKNHPYDVPEVISFKIDQGNPAYLDFLKTNTEDKKTD